MGSMPDAFTVFLIDDDKVTLYLSEKVIRSIYPQATVIPFMNGRMALDAIKEADKDQKALLMLDINMPDYSGWDFLEDYSRYECKFPVFMYTSSIDLRDMERARKYVCVQGFITKPLFTEKLEQAFSVLNS